MIENYAPIDEHALAGFTQQRNQFRETQMAAAVSLLADVQSGSVPVYFLHEAIAPRTPAMIRSIQTHYPGIIRVSESMTTSDFPLLTGGIIDRMMLARYRETPSPWRQFAKVATLRDFRAVQRLSVDGLEGQWRPVPEGGEVTYERLGEDQLTYAPKKYALATKLSFEALLNDDLSAFDSIPDRLGRGGRRTVNRFVTSLYVDASGPHASLYTGGNGNIVTGNPALSIASLATALAQLRNRLDADGEPIMIEEAVLVVPPGLEVVARNILNATTVRLTTGGGASGQELEVDNWVGSSLTLAVDPYIPVIAQSNGATSWFIFASPNSGRPALEVGFVRGFQEPQLYQKLANTARVGGGVDQAAGDFATMSQEYKGVLAFGGTVIDPIATVASNGSGS